MKILESQSAIMTNVEVYQFLSKQQKEYQKKNRKGPETFEVLRKDVS